MNAGVLSAAEVPSPMVAIGAIFTAEDPARSVFYTRTCVWALIPFRLFNQNGGLE
jgi:hypothetical protein